MGAAKRPPPERRWRRLTRWLGGPDSWRRVIVTGATAGVTLAFVAALIAALVLGDGGSLDGDDPTVVPGDGGPIDGEPIATVEPLPTEIPIEGVPTEVPTDVPVEEPPTDVPVEEPTVPKEPPPKPTIAEGG